MIINATGGGGMGINCRNVSLDEVYFKNYYYDYTTYGYRTFCDSDRTNYYKTFYFPGKVVKILSYKYVFQTSHGGAWTAEQIFTGDWYIYANQATPALTHQNKYYYRPTELTAVIEDSVIGGTTTTYTISVDTWRSNYGNLNNLVSGNNIISCTLPANFVYLVGSLDISGCMFSTTASNYYPPSDLVFTIKQGTGLRNQGITYKDTVLNISSSGSSYLDIYTGFDPNFIVVSKTGEPSSALTVGQGMIAASWVRPGLHGLLYNNYYNSLIYNNYNGGDMFYPITVTYYPNWGMTRIQDGSTYPTGFYEGNYHVIAM